MKQYVKSILLSIIFVSSAEAVSRSFFRPRDVSTDNMFELATSNYDRYHLTPEERYHLYLKPFFIDSIKGRDISKYFLPNCKSCITLDESGNGDVNPLWFNLISPRGTFYTSCLCLSPKRKVAGMLLTFYANLTCRLWFGINTAAMVVKANAHLRETNRTQNGTIPGFQNACQAFNNPAWCAGKITNTTHKKGGLDDIQLKLGYDFCQNDCGHGTVYLVGTIPTGNRPKACFLFEPLVGSKHGSFGFGFDTDYNLLETDRYTFNVMMDFKYRYIFKATERRSFDLCNGDWSRYLLVVTQAQPLNSQPGINLLTMPAHVTPRSTVDLWAAANYQFCNWDLEIGYDFWWRAAEKVCKKCPIQEGFGIQTLTLCQTTITSAACANISQGAITPNATPNDAVFTPITDANINLKSGAQAASQSQKLYVAVAWPRECRWHARLFGLGASYEFATKNALHQWSIWGTVGVSF